MCISKVGQSGRSAGLINYLIRELNAAVIGGTFYGTKRDILAQSAAWNRICPNLECNTSHLIESYPPGEEVSDEVINLRVKEKLTRLGFNDCPYLVVRHTDKHHYLHVHILVSRIRADGTIVDDSNLALRAIAVTKELDAELGMQQTPFRFRSERIRRKEYEMMRQTGTNSRNEMLRHLILDAAKKSEKNAGKFFANLEKENIGFWLFLNEDKTGIKGISFDCEKTGHKQITGGGLGRGFSFPKLSEIIGYQTERDLPKLLEKYRLGIKPNEQAKSKKSKGQFQDLQYILISDFGNESGKDKNEIVASAGEDFQNKKSIKKVSFPLENWSAPSAFEAELLPAEKAESPDKFSSATSAIKHIEKGDSHDSKLERNKYKNSCDSSKDQGSVIEDQKAKLFYKTPGEEAETFVKENSPHPSVGFKIYVQRKIDSAFEKAESFSEFLHSLQRERILCLPENDAVGRVSGLTFVGNGIAVSSDELGENYNFQSLAKKIKFADAPVFASENKSAGSFQEQADALRDKSLSDYWWKMKAETDETERIKINPAAFEFLRVAYKQTFNEDVKNFEIIFQDAERTNRFLDKLTEIKDNVGIYEECTASLTSILTKAQQSRSDKKLVFLTLGEEYTGGFFENNTEEDKIFETFKLILRDAGIEKALESEDARATLETVGQYPSRFELEIKTGEIKFSEAFEPKSKYVENTARGITFAKNSQGNFQYTGSFVRETAEQNTVPEYDKDAAQTQVNRLQNIGSNVLVTKIEAAPEIAQAVESQNEQNALKYLRREKGSELLAEAKFRAARFEATDFQHNLNEVKLAVTAVVGDKEETREISYSDLMRERKAIARAEVAEDKKTGVLEMIAEEKELSLEAAEKRQFGKAMVKAEELQKPWIKALDEAVAGEQKRLEEKVSDAETEFKSARADTAAVAMQTGIKNDETIKPAIQPEKVWIEQIKAVKRGDAETFEKMEAVHQELGLPRPNDVYARLKGMEQIAATKSAEAKRELAEWVGNDRQQDKIIVNVRPDEKGELKVENWRVREVEAKHAELLDTAKENRKKAEEEPKMGNREAFRPLWHKINPLSPVQGSLSWFTDPKATLNNQINPIQIVKNNDAVQIVRAVAGYVEHTAKRIELNRMANKATEQAEFLKEKFASDVAGNASRLNESVKSAIEKEKNLRSALKGSPDVNSELLKTPEASLTDAELKQVGETAVKNLDAKGAAEYYDVVKADAEFAEIAGETGERLTAKSLLAEAKAAWQANRAIESVNPLPDGSIDVEINPAQLESAIEGIKTAEAVESAQTEIVGKSLLQQLSLEDTLQAEKYLAGNSPLTESLENQVTKIGDELMRNLQAEQQMSETERQLLNQMSLSEETQMRFSQIQQSNRFVDAMARQGELATENNVPFQKTAQNFEVIHSNREVENREYDYWKQERAIQDSRVTGARSEKLQSVSQAEAEAIKAAELEEAAKHEEEQTIENVLRL